MDLTTSLKARDTEDRQLVKSHATIFVVPSTMLYNRVRPRFEFHIINYRFLTTETNLKALYIFHYIFTLPLQ